MALFLGLPRWASSRRNLLLDCTVQGNITETEADTLTIRLGATPSGLISDPPPTSPPPFLCQMPFLLRTKPLGNQATEYASQHIWCLFQFIPIYQDKLGQAPNMLACILSSLVAQWPCNPENTIVSNLQDELYIVLGDSDMLHTLCFTYCRNTVSMLLTVQTCPSHWSPPPTYLQLPSIAVSLHHHTRTPMSLHVQWKMSFSCCSCYLPLPLTRSLLVRHLTSYVLYVCIISLLLLSAVIYITTASFYVTCLLFSHFCLSSSFFIVLHYIFIFTVTLLMVTHYHTQVRFYF